VWNLIDKTDVHQGGGVRPKAAHALHNSGDNCVHGWKSTAADG
jgi:hypothetical protein